MFTAVVAALIGAIGGITLWKGLGLAFSVAKKAGADKKLDGLVEGIGEIHVSSKSAVFNDAINVALNHHAIPLLKNQLVEKGLIDDFTSFMATGPDKTAIIEWLLAHGITALTALEDDLPDLAKEELGVLGHDLGGVLGELVSKAAAALGASAPAKSLAITPKVELKPDQISEGLKNLVKPPAPAGV